MSNREEAVKALYKMLKTMIDGFEGLEFLAKHVNEPCPDCDVATLKFLVDKEKADLKETVCPHVVKACTDATVAKRLTREFEKRKSDIEAKYKAAYE